MEAIDRLLATLSNLPVGMHGGALLALLAGLALWLFGAKILKPMFALLGMALGSLAGAIALPLLGIMQVGSFPSVYVGLGAGALVGLVVACLLFRFALIVASGIVFTAAGVLGAATYLNFQSPGMIDPPARLLLAPAPDRSIDEHATPSTLTTIGADGAVTTIQPTESSLTGLGAEGADAIAGVTLPKVQEQAAKARAFLDEMGQRGNTAWASVGARERLVLTGGGVLGATIGVLFGIMMPKRSGAMVTSLFGASVVLFAAVWLAGATDAPGKSLLEQPPMTVAIGLVVATMLGMLLQLTVTNKRAAGAPKPAGA